MTYQVNLKRSAEKELERLPKEIHDKIVKRLFSLKDHPHIPGAKKLLGGERYRIRVGQYRILYGVDESQQIIEVFSVGHRKEVYRRE